MQEGLIFGGSECFLYSND